MAIKALMVDVDGVLIDGRPGDGRHWQASLEEDLGIASTALHEHFFATCWDSIVVGRAGLMDHLPGALRKIAPHVTPDQFVRYWFERDAHVAGVLLAELGRLRATGIKVYLATNQEHLRAAYLMGELGLSGHVDGIFYSANLGVKKPDGRFFTKVQEAVGLAGEEMLLIDDSLPNVEAALKAGWQAVIWTRESSPEMLRELCVL